MSKKIMMLGKSVPLLSVVLGALLLTGASAVLVLYWTSSTVTYQYTFTTSGLSAMVIDIPDTGVVIADYLSFLDYFADPESHVATVLKTAVLEENAFGFPVTRAVAFAYEGGNIGGDLVLDINVNITGEGSGDVLWTVSSRLAGVYDNTYNGVGPCMQDSDLADYVFDGSGRLTIPEAEISRITWVPVANYIQSAGIPVGYSNFMMLEFSFSGGGAGIGPEDYGTHAVNVDITIDASVDDGA